MKVVRLSALGTGHLYLPGNIPSTHFCLRLSQPQGHSAAGKIISYYILYMPLDYAWYSTLSQRLELKYLINTEKGLILSSRAKPRPYSLVCLMLSGVDIDWQTAAIIVRIVLSISSWSLLHNWMIKGIVCLVCSKQPMVPWRYTKAGFNQWMSPRREEPRTAASGITFFKVSSIVKWQLLGSWCVAAGVWILSRVYKICLSCDV